jgi:glycine/D-amino acid oxidase-like deaminating enzyme
MENIPTSADVVICGAGIAGVSIAYYLRQYGVKNVVIVDQDPPLSRTSSRSAECYRNWFSTSFMIEFMEHSIALMEKLAEKNGNSFHVNRRGYLYASFDAKGRQSHLEEWIKKKSAGLKGDVRFHYMDSTKYDPNEPPLTDEAPGVDWLLGNAAATAYPYLSPNLSSLIHVRRCGWLDAQQMGTYMYDDSHATFIPGRVTGLGQDKKGITDVILSDGSHINTRFFVCAAGPWVNEVATLLGHTLTLPIKNVLHEKLVFNDVEGILPRDAPMIICSPDKFQPQIGTNEEREIVQVEPAAGIYLRPEGRGQSVLVGWAYDQHLVASPIWPPKPNYHKEFRDVALIAAARLVKGFEIYTSQIQKLGKPFWGSDPHDGGYYAETEDKCFLIGPFEGVPGAFFVSGLGGLGVMASNAAGELAAQWVTGTALPDYADKLTMEYWKQCEGKRGEEPPL